MRRRREVRNKQARDLPCSRRDGAVLRCNVTGVPPVLRTPCPMPGCCDFLRAGFYHIKGLAAIVVCMINHPKLGGGRPPDEAAQQRLAGEERAAGRASTGPAAV